MLREMKIADYAEMIDLWTETEGVGVRDSDSKEGTEFYLARNPGLSFVFEQHGKVVGTIMADHDGRRGYVQHLVVSADARGRGIGRLLVTKCISALKDAGILKSHIHVFQSNESGQQFWRYLGWKERTDLKTFSFINSENENV